jgi:hypothetical protein
MLSLLPLLYRDTTKIRSPDGYAVLRDFGFDVGATYNVTFSDFNPTREYCFVLLPSDASFLSTTIGAPCDGAFPNSHLLGGSDSVIEISGVINSRAVYRPYLSFLRDGETDLEITVDGIFRNPTSFMDFRWEHVITEKLLDTKLEEAHERLDEIEAKSGDRRR